MQNQCYIFPNCVYFKISLAFSKRLSTVLSKIKSSFSLVVPIKNNIRENRIVLRNRYGKNVRNLPVKCAEMCGKHKEFVRDRYGVGAECIRNTHGFYGKHTE